ncbi:MAG: right-handed parallel beta-helix repeat-containing protein, partial [Holophagales bacterium]|nr:right-handed parallel beta-helix repeat-containing protein [Holophagales bacterium]
MLQEHPLPIRRPASPLLAASLPAAITAALAVGPALPAGAATFTVTHLGDNGAGSLRQAILDANLTPGADQIVFDSQLTGRLELASALPSIQESIDILGPGAERLSLDANQTGRVLEFRGQPESVYLLEGLRLEGGSIASGGGGGIALFDGRLTLEGMQVAGNLTSDSGCGGGIFGSFETSLTLRRSIVAGNRAGCGGGLAARNLVIEQSAIYDNRARTTGAGIWSDSSVGLFETTVSGNRGTAESPVISSGAGIEIVSGGDLLLYQVT